MKFGMVQWIFLFFFSSSLFAFDLQELQKEGEALFYVGKYEDCQKLFERLLNKKLSPAQRATTFYNVGSALIAQKRWEEAIIEFQKIDQKGDFPPSLFLNLYTNWAYALWKLAEEKEGLFNREEETFVEEASSVINSLEEALFFLDKREEAEKLKVLLEGGSEENSRESLEWKRFVKQKIINLKKELFRYELERITLEKGVPILLGEGEETLSQLDDLAKRGTTEEQQFLFLKLFSRAEKKLDSLWEALRKDLSKKLQEVEEEELEKIKQKEALFLEAEHQHNVTIAKMEEGELKESKRAQEIMTAALRALLENEKNREEGSEGEEQKEKENPEDQNNGEGSPQQADEEGEGNGEGEEIAENTPPQNILEALQEMHREDKSPQERKLPPKKGLRPW